MEVKIVFRKLVTGQYMPEFAYNDEIFQFKTVFYKSSYSYCCCSCGFHNEFLDYISNDGSIQEEIYEEIVKNIINGKCAHINEVPSHYQRQTCVSGMYVAAAVGTDKAIAHHLNYFNDHTSALFHLKPHYIALLKKQFNNARLFHEVHSLSSIYATNRNSDVMLYSSKTKEILSRIKITEMAYTDLCVKTGNKALLENVFSQRVIPGSLNNAFDIAIKYDFVDIQELFLQYFENIRISLTSLFRCVDSAILYNRPKTLENILKRFFLTKYKNVDFKHRVNESCVLLERNECRNVLLECKVFLEPQLSVEDKMYRLLNLLDIHYDDFKDEISTVLAEVSNKHKVSIIQYLEKFVTFKPRAGSKIVKTILKLSRGDHSYHMIDEKLLLFVLDNINMYDSCARETLKLLIYENPDIEQLRFAVHLGLQQDSRLKPLRYVPSDFAGNYHMDAREHGLFEDNGPDGFVYNFMGPFLIECGFLFTSSLLRQCLDKQLHSTELDYLQQCLVSPRRLTLSCRDSLRKHFKGHKIHKYLDITECPQSVKDFILIKRLLETSDY